MIKFCSIIGTRPQILKYAAIHRAMIKHKDVDHICIHTNQHYDENLSDVFFKELGLPEPIYNLHVGSMSSSFQVGSVMMDLELIFREEKPDLILLYGDSNSSIAGALTAAYMKIPTAHIESGMRCLNKSMVEEINRRMTDHLSTLLFLPSMNSYRFLQAEGIPNKRVTLTGDVMLDNALYYGEKTTREIEGDYFLATLHRAELVDDQELLHKVMEQIIAEANHRNIPIIMPLHPRTRKKLTDSHPLIKFIEPVSYIRMLGLIKHSKLVITDSGGVQKDAYYMKRPVIVVRDETEWEDITAAGALRLALQDASKLHQAIDYFLTHEITFPPLFGEGHAADICMTMCRRFCNLPI